MHQYQQALEAKQKSQEDERSKIENNPAISKENKAKILRLNQHAEDSFWIQTISFRSSQTLRLSLRKWPSFVRLRGRQEPVREALLVQYPHRGAASPEAGSTTASR